MVAEADVPAILDRLHERLSMRENLFDGQAHRAAPTPSNRFFELRRHEAATHHLYGAFGREIRIMRPGWRGKIESIFKRVVRGLLGWHARPQVEFNTAVMHALAETTRHIEGLAAEIESLRSENASYRHRLAEARQLLATAERNP